MADIEAERAWLRKMAGPTKLFRGLDAYRAELRVAINEIVERQPPGPRKRRPKNWRRRRFWTVLWPYYVVVGRPIGKILLH